MKTLIPCQPTYIRFHPHGFIDVHQRGISSTSTQRSNLCSRYQRVGGARMSIPEVDRLHIRAATFLLSAAVALNSMAAFAIEREPLTPQFYIDQVFESIQDAVR
jgi:hypothetical protein